MFNPFIHPSQVEEEVEKEKKDKEENVLIAHDLAKLMEQPGWKHVENWLEERREGAQWTTSEYLRAEDPKIVLSYNKSTEDLIDDFHDWVNQLLTIINDEHYEQEESQKSE